MLDIGTTYWLNPSTTRNQLWKSSTARIIAEPGRSRPIISVPVQKLLMNGRKHIFKHYEREWVFDLFPEKECLNSHKLLSQKLKKRLLLGSQMWGVMNTHAHITSPVPHSVFHITSHLRVNTFPFSSESIHADRDLDGPLPRLLLTLSCFVSDYCD